MKLRCVLVAAFLSAAASAHATTVLRLMPEEIFGKADIVFTGRVARIEAKPAVGPATVITEVIVSVETCIKGECGAMESVIVPGGSMGAGGLKIFGAPEFEVGDHVLLALESTSPPKKDGEPDIKKQGPWRVRGLHQGRYTLAVSPTNGETVAVEDPFREFATAQGPGKYSPDAFKNRAVLTMDEVRKLSGAKN